LKIEKQAYLGSGLTDPREVWYDDASMLSFVWQCRRRITPLKNLLQGFVSGILPTYSTPVKKCCYGSGNYDACLLIFAGT